MKSLSVFSNRLDQHFRRAGPLAEGIKINCVAHQGSMHQCFEKSRASSPRGRQHIMGETPARIEGHAKAVHWDSPDKCFEAQLRGNHIYGTCLFKQGGRMSAACFQYNPRMFKVPPAEMPSLSPIGHFRMGFQHNQAIGMPLEC